MWQVWWSNGARDAVAEQVDEFEHRAVAETMAAAIYLARGGNVALVHVVNGGTEFEHATYWTMTAVGNGWKMTAMAPKASKKRRNSRSKFSSAPTPGALAL